MGGFAALLGGLGAGAQEYGRQVRTIQEQQRESYMGMLQNEAQQESDPEHRSNLFQGLADLASGKPVSYVNKNIAKSRQKRDQADFEAGAPHVQAAVQGLLANQASNQPQPGQYPGVPPGMLPPGAAAQPQTSPVNPLVQMSQPSPQLPESIAQPWAYTPDMPGTTLPPSEEQAAGLQAALPQAGAQAAIPQPGTEVALPQAPGTPQDYFDQADQTLLNFERNPRITPYVKDQLRPMVQARAETTRQLGVAQAFVQMKQGIIERLRPQVEAQINQATGWQKSILQNQWFAAQLEASSPMGGFTGVSALSPMLSAMRLGMPKFRVVGTPQGNMLGILDPQTGQVTGYAGRAPIQYKEGDEIDEQGNPIRVAIPMGAPGLPAIPEASSGPGTKVVPPFLLQPKYFPTQDAGVMVTNPYAVAHGLPGIPVKGAVTPAMEPTTTQRAVTVQGPQGAEVHKEEFTTSKGVRAGAGGGADNVIGVKAITPQDILHSNQQTSNQLDKIYNPEVQLLQRAQRLTDNINQNTPQADALLAPELLTVVAGGFGSGLRMNEAELARVVGGRSIWESLKATLNQVQLDPSKANSITAAQRNQMRAIIDEINRRAQARMGIITQAQQDLANSTSIDEHRQILARVHSQLVQTALPEATGGGAAQGGYEIHHMYGGMEYLGGDPKQKTSWKKR